MLFLLAGPNFNVTVGPNGSGKSSIVTALSICLGGDIKSLNRQSDIQSLVNHDTQNPTAEVEIELFFNKSENLVVRTVFGREQGSQTWMVNGKAKSRQV
jgi:chromosome segregation ATPase